MFRLAALTLLSLLVTLPVAALEFAGVELKPAISVHSNDDVLTLNGAGIRSKFFIKVYVAALYLREPKSDARIVLNEDQPNRILMHFLRDGVTRQKMRDAWHDGFAANSPDAVNASLIPRLKQFVGLFDDMHEDDVVWLDYAPGEGTRVTINGETKGNIPGKDFNAALLGVWLGNKPVTESLKNALLGK